MEVLQTSALDHLATSPLQPVQPSHGLRTMVQRVSRVRIIYSVLVSYGAEGGTRTRTPLRAQRPQRCLSTNSNTSAQVLAGSNVRQGRRDSNPRPSVLETDALAS